jgi:hypothetical protein
MPRVVWLGVTFTVLLVGAVLVQFAVHTYRTDPRDTRAIVERELRVNTLQSGETVREAVSVFKRPAIDYFRATRGLLVLTDRRLLYLGLQPRDLLASGEGPPTFEQREFPLDTLVQLTPGRTFFFVAKAIEIQAPGGGTTLGVPSGAWSDADTLMARMRDRHMALRREGERQTALRVQRERERRAALVAASRPVLYVVKRGDAVSTIAAQWNTTPERLREWNGLTGDRIRGGQALIVRR